ncbi:MAG: c-type cytochrome [Archangium sp.]|nr:c-type cytochrome [Archangium sp.]
MRRAGAVLVALSISCAAPEEEVSGFSGGGGGVGGVTHRSARPLVGGTVLVGDEGRQAVVSDPERDVVHLVSLTGRTVRASLKLPAGAQPARAIWPAGGNVQVVLRGAGAIATIDPVTLKLVSTKPVCPEPRGIAWDEAHQATLVACASGELVTLQGPETTVRRFDADLRDVLVGADGITLTTFRTPTVRRVDGPTVTLPVVSAGRPMAPTAAFRSFQTAHGVVVVHQDAADDDVRTVPPPPMMTVTTTPTPSGNAPPPIPAYYGNGQTVPPCNAAVVRSAVTLISGDAVVGSLELGGVLPLDAALSPNGAELAVVHAGNSQLVRLQLAALRGSTPAACAPLSAPVAVGPDGQRLSAIGNPIGVAFLPSGDLLVHSREPSALHVLGARSGVIRLGGGTVETPGQRLFHEGVGGIACASCHLEGQEDGHVWTLEGQRRRTQSLAGGLGTAPFHWDGTLPTLTAVLDETFVRRMGGPKPDADVVKSLEAMMKVIPVPKAPTRDTPVDLVKGKAAFVKAGCEACHAGADLTNDRTMDVGTGGPLQVPSLVGLAGRGPWMHDGCAKTLEERFTNDRCGGGRHHGSPQLLTPDERSALIAWLGQQ